MRRTDRIKSPEEVIGEWIGIVIYATFKIVMFVLIIMALGKYVGCLS